MYFKSGFYIHHPGESGRRGSRVGGQGSGGGVWVDSAFGCEVASPEPDEAGDTSVSATPPVMYPPVGVPGPITVAEMLTYVGARVARQDYNTHTNTSREHFSVVDYSQ